MYCTRQPSRVPSCLGNEQINQCQLDTVFKAKPHPGSQTVALNSRKRNYAAKAPPKCRGSERMRRRLQKALTVFYLHALRYPPERRPSSASMRGRSRSGSPVIRIFHVVIRTQPDATVCRASLHKYADLQSPFSAPPPPLVPSFR